jgi:hypothetical protein
LDALKDCCHAGLLLEQDQANYCFTHHLSPDRYRGAPSQQEWRNSKRFSLH